MRTRGLVRRKLFILILLCLLFVARGDQVGVEAQGLVEYSLLQLRIPLNSDPGTLIPNDPGSNISSQFVMNQLYESFFRYSPEGDIVPAGASGYEVSEDGLTYTISLRQDAYWSDTTPEEPTPVIAQHYIDGMLAVCGTDWDYLFYPINNFQDWCEDFIMDPNTEPTFVGISSPDYYTVVISLESPAAYFIHVLAWFKYPIRVDLKPDPEDPDPDQRPYVNNGPYHLYEWADDYLWLEKNPYYWDAENVQFVGIQLPIMEDLAEQLDAYQNGDLDVSGYPPELYPDIMADPVLSAEHHTQPQHGVYYLGLNTTLSPTSNRDLRIALASSIKRRDVLDLGLVQGELDQSRHPRKRRDVLDLVAAKAKRDQLRQSGERRGVGDPVGGEPQPAQPGQVGNGGDVGDAVVVEVEPLHLRHPRKRHDVYDLVVAERQVRELRHPRERRDVNDLVVVEIQPLQPG